MSIKLCEVTLTFIGGSIPDIAEGHTHFIEHMFCIQHVKTGHKGKKQYCYSATQDAE